MNKALIIFLSIIFYTLGNSQSKPVFVSPEISKITVYLNGAEIKRDASIELKSGKNNIVLKGLSNYLQPNSVQISIEGDVEILGIVTKNDFLDIAKIEPRIQVLKDSLELLNREIKDLTDLIDGYNIEKQMLKQNQSIGGSNNGVSITELDKGTTFFRSRTWEINKAWTKLDRDKQRLEIERGKINNQLNDLNVKNNPSRKNVVVEADSPKEQKVNLSIRYLVGAAGWGPAYDIIAQDVDKDIELNYNGKVFNNTGIDWIDANLVLSTADPYQSASAPNLTPWYIDFDQGASFKQSFGRLNQMAPVQSEAMFDMDDAEIVSTGNVLNVNLAELSAEFEIEKRYTIPSDRKSYSVKIKEHQLDTQFEHFAVPKMDKDAFLLARIWGWEKLDLIDGPANIYYGDTFVGESLISTRSVEDTMDISLGRDKQIIVTRVKQEDFSSKGFIGSNRKESFAFEITVKNNRNIDMDITIKDQIPVSRNSEIDVNDEKYGSGSLDDLTGIVTWDLKLKPGETKKLLISYTVKYPKNRKVTLKRYRAANATYF